MSRIRAAVAVLAVCLASIQAVSAGPASAACADGVDNDGDGLVDYPHDPGCSSRTDTDEYNAPACSDGVDNDGDGLVDYPADKGCLSAGDDAETYYDFPCDDGVDNDGDGKVDWPADDGCSSQTDRSETWPACSDGIDNNGDGRTDYPDDPACTNADDPSEADPVMPGAPPTSSPVIVACGITICLRPNPEWTGYVAQAVDWAGYVVRDEAGALPP